MKVLLSAFACRPDKGSESGKSWNWAKQISRFHDVWVITDTNFQDVPEQAMEEKHQPRIHWIHYELPQWMRLGGIHLYYYLWQIRASMVARRLNQEVRFDLGHHVSFGSYWRPSFLAFVPIPYVWGPIGGGESAPESFSKSFSTRGNIYEHLRDIARWFGEHDPLVRRLARSARIALAATPQTEERLKKSGCQDVRVFTQSAISHDDIAELNSLPIRNENPFRLVSVGRFIHWKGFHLGLEAFARLLQEFPHSEYHLIGDGPERQNLERLAQQLNVTSQVHFGGEIPRKQLLAKLVEYDVLVHPSFCDSGGWVCLEAMAAGRPAICLDLGGPALQVTEETGVKVPAVSSEQVVDALAEAMCRLASDPILRRRMAETARARVAEHFDWNKKGEWIKEIYQEVVMPQASHKE